MVLCFVPDCTHVSKMKICKMLRFAKSPKRRKKWKILIRRGDRSPGKWARVCSCHFKDGDCRNLPELFNRNQAKRTLFFPPEKHEKQRINPSTSPNPFGPSQVDTAQKFSNDLLENPCDILLINPQCDTAEIPPNDLVINPQSDKAEVPRKDLPVNLQSHRTEVPEYDKAVVPPDDLPENSCDDFQGNPQCDTAQIPPDDSPINYQSHIIEVPSDDLPENAQSDTAQSPHDLLKSLQSVTAEVFPDDLPVCQWGDLPENCFDSNANSVADVGKESLQFEPVNLKEEVERLKNIVKSKEEDFATSKLELEMKLNEVSKGLSSKTRQIMILEAEIDTLQVQLKECKSRRKGFTISDIENSPKDVSHFTGLPNKEVFNLILGLFYNIQLNYYHGWNVKILSKPDQLLLTLFKLRRNPSFRDLARRFNVSQGTLENTFLTWLSALHQMVFVGLMRDIPSRFKNARSMPKVFKDFPNCRMIMDCTEIFAANPKKMSDQNDRYSN